MMKNRGIRGFLLYREMLPLFDDNRGFRMILNKVLNKNKKMQSILRV